MAGRDTARKDGGKAAKARQRTARPRNPLVPVVRGKPAKVIPSAKAYKRKPKHPKRRDEPSE